MKILQAWLYRNKERCPECHSKLIMLWSGVKCSRCKWWFCY
jgi:hypothetical protein